jgi:hypothetical protein
MTRTFSGALVALLAASGLAPTACGEEPPPYAPPASATSNLDQWLANVAGETVTRRMLVRAMDERGPDESEASYERKIQERLIGRVISGVLLWKAKQMGLDLRAAVVDEEVARAGRIEVENARKRGVNLTFPQILARRGQSLEEYTDLLRREMLVQEYWLILVRGIPGKRAQIDIEPSPSETLALYQKHRQAFDLAQGVRVAWFTAHPNSFLDRTGNDYEAALAAARAHAKALAAEAAGGRRPEDVARAHRLDRGDWLSTPEKSFLEKGAFLAPGGAETEAWLFDPARRAGEVTVVDAERGAVGSLAILEVRRARPRDYAEVLPDVLSRIRSVRMSRFRYAHLLEALAVAPVKPPGLVERIADELRTAQKHLDDDPVARDIRLR